MADNALSDVRGEDWMNLVGNRADMTGLDRIVSHGSSSNMFNNCISPEPGSSTS
jgi:hypothetical protein